MTRLRQLWLLTALGAVAVMAGGYFLLAAPQASKAAALRDEAETQLQQNKTLKSQIDMLNKQKKDLPAQQAKLAKFVGLIPNNPGLPALMRALSDAADNSGVELLSVSPKLPTYAKAVNPATGAELNSPEQPGVRARR
jgi:Tfp pilus assembly protein PilO